MRQSKRSCVAATNRMRMEMGKGEGEGYIIENGMRTGYTGVGYLWRV